MSDLYEVYIIYADGLPGKIRLLNSNQLSGSTTSENIEQIAQIYPSSRKVIGYDLRKV